MRPSFRLLAVSLFSFLFTFSVLVDLSLARGRADEGREQAEGLDLIEEDVIPPEELRYEPELPPVPKPHPNKTKKANMRICGQRLFFKGPMPRFRLNCAIWLGHYKDERKLSPRAMEGLKNTMKVSRGDVAEAAMVSYLKSMTVPQIVKEMEKAKVNLTRGYAARALGEISLKQGEIGEEAHAALKELYDTDGDPFVHAQAGTAVIRSTPLDELPYYLHATAKNDPVRSVAWQALIMRGRRAVGELQEVLGEGDEKDKIWVVRALAKIGGKESTIALAGYLELLGDGEKEGDVYEAVVSAIEQIERAERALISDGLPSDGNDPEKEILL